MILAGPICIASIFINPIFISPIPVDMIRCARCEPDLSSTIQQQGSTP
jgi:hypothetical protein